MSVQDIIYITCEEFKKHGNNIECLDKYKDIYRDLLKYECFTKPEITASRFQTPTVKGGTEGGYFKSQFDRSKHDKKPHYGHSYTRNVAAIRKRPTDSPTIQRPVRLMLSSDDASPNGKTHRLMKGLLNIINKDNYHKVSKKVLCSVSEDTVRCVIECILENACLQVFYLPIFSSLLEDVIKAFPSYSDSILETVNRFINEFIDQREFIFDDDSVSHIETKYLKFCKQQKHKSVASSKSIVVVHLLTKGLSRNWDLQSYSDFITGLLKDYISSEFNTDILITMLKSIKEKNQNIVLDLSTLTSIATGTDNQRWRFIIEELCQ